MYIQPHKPGLPLQTSSLTNNSSRQLVQCCFFPTAGSAHPMLSTHSDSQGEQLTIPRTLLVTQPVSPHAHLLVTRHCHCSNHLSWHLGKLNFIPPTLISPPIRLQASQGEGLDLPSASECMPDILEVGGKQTLDSSTSGYALDEEQGQRSMLTCPTEKSSL